ncbi:unnamed protein product [Boreogadus saida]
MRRSRPSLRTLINVLEETPGTGADVKVEEKKKDASAMRSSSSKESGSAERSSKSSEDLPPTPTSPTGPPRVTSFPPAPVTTDTVRTKCREMLVAALETDGTPELKEQVRVVLLWDALTGDETQEFRSTDMKYKSRLRSRISNLKDQKNPDLRRNVLCGNISPQQIATMRAEEMASKELKMCARQSDERGHQRDTMCPRRAGTETDRFSAAVSRENWLLRTVQTRSADEPMTTFVGVHRLWKPVEACVVCFYMTHRGGLLWWSGGVQQSVTAVSSHL